MGIDLGDLVSAIWPFEKPNEKNDEIGGIIS